MKYVKLWMLDAVMTAVNNGTLSEERINQSVRRILKLRKKINRAL